MGTFTWATCLSNCKDLYLYEEKRGGMSYEPCYFFGGHMQNMSEKKKFGGSKGKGKASESGSPSTSSAKASVGGGRGESAGGGTGAAEVTAIATATAAGTAAGVGANNREAGPDTLFRLILENDPDKLSMYSGSIHVVDKHGFSALMVAAMHRCETALHWCIRNGVGRVSVDKAERTENLTALMFACLKWSTVVLEALDKPDCVKLLLHAGANPALQSVKGETALHWAVLHDCINIVKFFATLPAFKDLVNIKNKGDEASGRLPQSPLELAREKRKTEIVDVMESALTSPPTAVDLVVNRELFGSDRKSLDPRIKLRKRVSSETEEDQLIFASIGDYLCSCARRGDIPVLVRFAAYIDSIDADGRTVLMSACVARTVDVVEWYFEVVPADRRFQLTARDDYSCTCVHFAAAGGKSKNQSSAMCMQRVVEAGADINATDNAGCTALHLAAQNGFDEIVTYLLSRSDCRPETLDLYGRDAAFYAESNGFPHVSKTIKEEIERRRRNARGKSKAVCKTMCDLIADNDLKALQAVRGEIHEKDVAGRTPLMQAALRRCEDILDWMLTTFNHNFGKGNAREQNKTPLMYACSPSDAMVKLQTNPRCVELLLSYTDDRLINQQSATGDTALHYAAAAGFVKIVKRLLCRRDLDVDIRNRDGKTAMEVALTASPNHANHTRIASLISQWDQREYVERCRFWNAETNAYGAEATGDDQLKAGKAVSGKRVVVIGSGAGFGAGVTTSLDDGESALTIPETEFGRGAVLPVVEAIAAAMGVSSSALLHELKYDTVSPSRRLLGPFDRYHALGAALAACVKDGLNERNRVDKAAREAAEAEAETLKTKMKQASAKLQKLQAELDAQKVKHEAVVKKLEAVVADQASQLKACARDTVASALKKVNETFDEERRGFQDELSRMAARMAEMDAKAHAAEVQQKEEACKAAALDVKITDLQRDLEQTSADRDKFRRDWSKLLEVNTCLGSALAVLSAKQRHAVSSKEALCV